MTSEIDLTSLDDRKRIAEFIKNEQNRLNYNQKIFQILEGDMKDLLETRMLADLGKKSYAAAVTRKAPINIFRKVVDKLTKIYSSTIVRTVEGGTESDKEILQWYENILQINKKMAKSNENFNAFLYSLIHIGLKNSETYRAGSTFKIPFARAIPNHQFLVYNCSIDDPSSDDIIITCNGYRKTAKGQRQSIYFVYSSSQFIVMDGKGDILTDIMEQYDQDGDNPYGVTPFAYANKSEDQPMPSVQTDNIDMALLVPLLITDLNYATKFQAFSMFVAIDLDDKSIEISPNAILSLMSKPTGEHPSFTSIKPTVDIDSVLRLISSTIGLWLTSKGLRPQAVGGIEAENIVSGISKIIDESDTYESINKQIVIYEGVESVFWDKLLKDIHPVWVASNMIEEKRLFSDDARVVTKFTKPVPLQSRGTLVRDLETEVEAGFTSVKRAVKMLNPELQESEIDELIAEVEAEDESPAAEEMEEANQNGQQEDQTDAASA